MPRTDLVVIAERCSVTAFDMKVTLSRDGRDRGLWIWMEDASKGRIEMTKEFLNDEFNISDRKYALSEGALLEWPAIEKFHKEMGKAIKLGKAAEAEYIKAWNARIDKMNKAKATKAKKRRKKK